jgi:hypothetical protein
MSGRRRATTYTEKLRQTEAETDRLRKIAGIGGGAIYGRATSGPGATANLSVVARKGSTSESGTYSRRPSLSERMELGHPLLSEVRFDVVLLSFLF